MKKPLSFLVMFAILSSFIPWGGKIHAQVLLPQQADIHLGQLEEQKRHGKKINWKNLSLNSKYLKATSSLNVGSFISILDDDVVSSTKMNAITSTRNEPVLFVDSKHPKPARIQKMFMRKQRKEKKAVARFSTSSFSFPDKISKRSRSSKLKNWFFPRVSAREETPILSFEEVRKGNLFDTLFFELAQMQQENGSFGTARPIETTFAILNALESWNKVESTGYLDAFMFLKQASSTVTSEQASHILFLHGQNLPFEDVYASVTSKQNPDGGFGYRESYQSDLLTTLEVLNMMITVQEQPDEAMSRTLLFVLRHVSENGSVSVVSGGRENYALAARMLQVLFPLREHVVESEQNTWVVQETIERIFSFMESSEYFTLFEQALLSQVLVLYERNPSLVLELNEKILVSDYSENIFLDPFSLLQVLLATATPDLEVISIVPQGVWVNGTPGVFDLTLKNTGFQTIRHLRGNIFVDQIFFETIEEMIPSGSEILPGQEFHISITLQDTSAFIGDTRIDFSGTVFGDRELSNNSAFSIVPVQSSIQGSPSVPLFFVAHKMVSAGSPAINVRWNKKFDPNRQNYILRYRIKGAPIWQSVAISNDWNGVILGNLSEGEVYEIVVGVQQGNGDLFISDTPVSVLVSADETHFTTTSSLQVIGLESVDHLFLENYGTSTFTNQSGSAILSSGNGTNAAWVEMPAYEPYQIPYVSDLQSTSSSISIFSKLKADQEAPILNSVSLQLGNGTAAHGQSVRILVRGQDNVALKNIELYYYEPHEAEWVYITTVEPNLSNGGNVFWLVPPGFIGPGYQIRAILSDFQNNRSAPLDSLPFTILDGTPPSFELTLMNSEAPFSLGQSIELQWDTNASHPVSKVSIDVLHQKTGFIKQIAKNIPNTGSFVWNIPFDSAFAGNDFQFRVSGKDSETFVLGEALSNPFSLVDSSPAPALPWQRPTVLEQEVSDVVALVSDVSGTIHMVYKTYPQTFLEDMEGQVAERLWYRALKQGEWSEAISLYDNFYIQNGDTWLAPSIRNLQMEVDASSTLHILWESSLVAACQAENEKEIWYMHGTADNFSSPINISQNDTISESAKLLVDRDNRVHVAWMDGNFFDQSCTLLGNRSVWYKIFENNQWSEPEVLPLTNAYSMQLAQTLDGQIHLVFFDFENSRLVHRLKALSGWGNESVLPVEEFFIPKIDLLAGQNNELFVAYEHEGRDGTDIWFSTISELGWSDPEQIIQSPDGWSTHDPKILLDHENNLQLIFAQEQDGPLSALSRLVYWTQKNSQENGWKLPQKISLDSQRVLHNSLRFEVGENGLLGVVYVAPLEQQNALFFVSTQEENTPLEPEPVQNLIVDGDMESEGLEAWRSLGKKVRFEKSSSSYAGEKSLYLDSLGKNFGFQQTDIPVEAKKHYRYSFRYKLLSGRIKTSLTMNGLNGDFEGKKINLKSHSGEWQTYSREFTVPENFEGNFRLIIRIRDGEGYIDDVMLQEISEITLEDNNLLRDGSMENKKLGPWRRYGRPVTLEKTTSTQFDGGQSLRVVVKDTPYGVQQRNISVEPGQRYRLSFSYQVLGTVIPRLGMNTSTQDFEFALGATEPLITSTPNGVWARYEREFTVPENFEGDFRLIFYLLSEEVYSSSDRRDLPFGELFLDDVKITKIR